MTDDGATPERMSKALMIAGTVGVVSPRVSVAKTSESSGIGPPPAIAPRPVNQVLKPLLGQSLQMESTRRARELKAGDDE